MLQSLFTKGREASPSYLLCLSPKQSPHMWGTGAEMCRYILALSPSPVLSLGAEFR